MLYVVLMHTGHMHPTLLVVGVGRFVLYKRKRGERRGEKEKKKEGD